MVRAICSKWPWKRKVGGEEGMEEGKGEEERKEKKEEGGSKGWKRFCRHNVIAACHSSSLYVCSTDPFTGRMSKTQLVKIAGLCRPLFTVMTAA